MELLIQSIIISLFCVGLRIVSGQGMILWFLRFPYIYLQVLKEENELKPAGTILHYILKPVIGCVTCMSSVWGVTLSYIYYELNLKTILVIFIVAYLNTFLYNVNDKLG